MSHRFSEMGSDLRNIDIEAGLFGAELRDSPAKVQHQTVTAARTAVTKFPFPLPASLYDAGRRLPSWAKAVGVVSAVGFAAYFGKKFLLKK